MKVGDIVTIYEDPITCEHPEGKAKLISFVKNDIRHEDELSLWYVQFPDDLTEYQRWIKQKGEN